MLPNWHSHVQIFILIISIHIPIHRMELQTGTNPIKTIHFICLILNVSKKLITSEYILICLQMKLNVYIQVSKICCLYQYLILKYIQNIPNHNILTALFDSGGTISLIHEGVLLTEVTPLISTNQIFTTLAGEFQSDRQVHLQEIILPEFECTAYIMNHTCQVFIGPCAYIIILG
jgi:hypothetical protein